MAPTAVFVAFEIGVAPWLSVRNNVSWTPVAPFLRKARAG